MATSTNTFLLILTFIGGTSLALNARDTPPENLLVHSAQITVSLTLSTYMYITLLGYIIYI